MLVTCPCLIATYESQADRVIAASVDEDSLIKITEFTERQRLQQIDDDIVDLLVMLDSTLDTIASIEEEYIGLSTHQGIDLQISETPKLDPIRACLLQKRKETLLYKSKAEHLRAKVSGTTELVHVSRLSLII